MPNYILKIEANKVEVHDESAACKKLPEIEDRRNLGWFSSGAMALYEAQKTYANAKACRCAR